MITMINNTNIILELIYSNCNLSQAIINADSTVNIDNFNIANGSYLQILFIKQGDVNIKKGIILFNNNGNVFYSYLFGTLPNDLIIIL